MYVAANESKAVLASEDFKVGTSISGVTVFDSFTRTVTAKNGELVIDGLVAEENPAVTRKFTVKYGSSVVDLTGSSTVYTTDPETGKMTATISGVSGITDGHEYSVTVTDKRTVSTEAQTLAEFTATGTVTNNSTINVTDADFTAASVDNDGEFIVKGTSELDIASLDGEIKTAGAATTLKDSSITGNGTNGTLTAQGALTFTGANTLTGVTLTASAENTAVTGRHGHRKRQYPDGRRHEHAEHRLAQRRNQDRQRGDHAEGFEHHRRRNQRRKHHGAGRADLHRREHAEQRYAECGKQGRHGRKRNRRLPDGRRRKHTEHRQQERQ